MNQIIKGDTMKREFYTVPEFAEMIGVSTQHIWNMLRRGKIKKIKVGERSLIPASELQRLIDSAE